MKSNKCADGVFQAFSCMSPGKNFSPARWGTLVRNASPHKGHFPRISIWHGTADTRVVLTNAAELVDQWTNVHGIDQIPDGQEMINGHAHQVFKDASGKVLVETFMIANMGHRTPDSTGTRRGTVPAGHSAGPVRARHGGRQALR
jgi:poly(3-hydroxybutyrate) depolymerase